MHTLEDIGQKIATGKEKLLPVVCLSILQINPKKLAQTLCTNGLNWQKSEQILREGREREK